MWQGADAKGQSCVPDSAQQIYQWFRLVVRETQAMQESEDAVPTLKSALYRNKMPV